ncbi:MAG: flotillin domain-containing protein [Pseudomonadota bacterium]
MVEILIPVGVILLLLVLVGLVLARLYRRTTREVSIVKTGSGGKRVIMDGGTVAIPLLHEVSYVNMKTLRLEVRRSGEAAMITQDRMRVDVGVEFYVSVNATEEGVAKAAQTLGERTFDAEALREMIEGKLVDGLRAVAAQMTMDGLHENRADFVQEVQNAVSVDLLKNGLELESVSLTALDQTPFDQLDENNAFNAVGMRKLAEVIAKSKKERAEIEADAQVAVSQANMDAVRQTLEITRQEEEARIQQEQEIATARATQEAEVARRREMSEKESSEARIAKERDVRAAEIAREKIIREAEIAKEREIEVADQDRQIIIAEKSEEESRARASADLARAEATKATEAVVTAREVAEAERQERVILIEARREAEKEATRLRLMANAEKVAASDRAEARREDAQGEADALNIKAEAKKNDLLAEAEGRRAIVEAENFTDDRIIDMKIDIARLEAMPGIIAEMVKPAEKISEIKIHNISGGGVGGALGGTTANEGGKPVVNQALDSILGMAVQLPALKKIGEELGLSLESGMGEAISGAIEGKPEPEAEEDDVTKPDAA